MDGNSLVTVAASTTELSKIPPQSLTQPLGRDVAVPCSIRIGCESYESQMVVLMAILQGITENTVSGDVIALGVYQAKDICRQFGIADEQVNEVISKYLRFSDQIRKKNPLAF